MKVRVDCSLCAGRGNYAAADPSVFQLDKGNKAMVIDFSLWQSNG